MPCVSPASFRLLILLAVMTAANAFVHVQPAQAQPPRGYTVTDLGTLGGESSFGFAINASGAVTGQSNTEGNSAVHAFLYSSGTMVDLTPLVPRLAYGFGINDAGDVVGPVERPSDFGIDAIMFSNGSMTNIGSLGGGASLPWDINNSRDVTGLSFTASFEQRAFLYSHGTMSDLGTLGGSRSEGRGINGRAQVTGYAATLNDESEHAFLYSNGTMTDLGTLGGSRSLGDDVNELGDVAGWSLPAGDVAPRAVLWADGSLIDLGTLGGNHSEARAVNVRRWVTGMSSIEEPNQSHAFLWCNGTMLDLNDLIPADSGWTLTEGGDINDRGQITGQGTLNGSTHAFLLTPSNASPLAHAGADTTVESQGALTTVALDGSGSSDPDNDQLEFEWSIPAESGATLDDPTSATPTGRFPTGPTLVTLTVTDGQGGVAVDDILVTVVDTTPPVLVCTTDRIALWSQDHTMQAVEVCISVSDNCVMPENLLLNCAVSSNEPDDANGTGRFTGDVNGSDGFTRPVALQNLVYDPDLGCYFGRVWLRSERDGSASGRVYSIVCDVLDTQANLATASCVVVVPHDKKRP